MLASTARFNRSLTLRCGASTLVLAAALLPSTAYAQVTDPAEQNGSKPLSTTTSTDAQNSPSSAPEKDAIIVTGQRRALQSARQRKKNADTVMDSIDATDIGAFPDKSVAEALQRVPGITVNRFSMQTGPADTAHFAAEPAGVLIRGLPQVRNELNGRDVFSATSGGDTAERGLSWSDVPAELLAGVDVYKEQTADLIEGGIAGTVSLRTRVPFDATGQLIQVGVKANYGDISKKWSPDANIFYSNRWQTGIGEIGIMGHAAYSRLKTASQDIQYLRAFIFQQGTFPNSADVNSNDFAPGTVVVPSQLTFRNDQFDRKRLGLAGSAQWRSNDHKWLATAQFLRSTYKNQLFERTHGATLFGAYGVPATARFVSSCPPDLGASNCLTNTVQSLPGAPDYTFDQNGFFQSGTVVNDTVWTGFPAGTPPWGGTFGPYTSGGVAHNDQGQPMFYPCYGWSNANGGLQYPGGPACTSGQSAPDVYTTSRYNNDRDMIQDAALNLKFDPTARLHFNFDGQYIRSTHKNYDVEIDLDSFAVPTITTDANGLPRMTLAPATTALNINQSAGGLNNPDNWYVRSVMDHLEDSKGREYSLRGDGEYEFQTDWLDSIKWGVRFADRKQDVRWSAYNWHNVSNTWTASNCQYIYFNLDSTPGTCSYNGQTTTFNGYPAGFYQQSNYGAPFFGGNFGSLPFVPFDFLQKGGADLFSAERTGVGSFVPICERNGQHTPGGDVILTELPNSCFTPDEVNKVRERTMGTYAMLKFGGDNALLGNMPLRGNIGVRFIHTLDVSEGSLLFPTVSGDRTQCPTTALVPGGITGNAAYPPGPPPPGVPPAAPYPAFCYLSAGDQAFANGAFTSGTVRAPHNNFLPSLNLRLDFTPQWLLRFSVNKAMARPSLGILKNYQVISMSLPNGNNLTDPRWVLNSAGQPIGVNPLYTASAFNPRLKPVTAWQGTLSLAHYFGQSGLLSAAVFYKKFYNYISQGAFELNYENAGTTHTVRVAGPANGSGATIKGFELAYNTFFDFLPGMLKGFGMQANYTYVKNSGIKNANLVSMGSTPVEGSSSGGLCSGIPATPDNPTGGCGNPLTAHAALNPGTLEGLSKHTFNLVGMYEMKDFPISARLAYNWRSKYLVRTLDCCVFLPIWQKAAGFLDGRIAYKVSEALEFSVEGSNLLNTRTKLLQQVTDVNSPEKKNILVPNAWLQQDRRYSFGVRWKMASAAPPPPPLPAVLPPPPEPAPATQTCPDGSVTLATSACAAPPPPPPPAPVQRGERGN
jgi:iron complex outermembrane receptor protein